MTQSEPGSSARWRDRWPVAAAVTAFALACWAYVVFGAGMAPMGAEAPTGGAMDGMAGMTGMAGMAAPASAGPGHFAALAGLWVVMMAAMMLPSAMPMILLFAAINRKAAGQGRPHAPTWLFCLGYLLIWSGFALGASAAQAVLDRLAWLTPQAALASRATAGLVILAVGLYQLTPLKTVCLRHCRSPMAFVMAHWRGGRAGALRMGLHHGLYCLGCCWCLMLLLFVGGAMNLLWMAALALYVVAEKTIPALPWAGGAWLERLSAAILVGWGGFVVISAVLSH